MRPIDPDKEQTLQYLATKLSYNPETGTFWRWGANGPLKRSGCLGPTGYWRLNINGKQLSAHRLVWLHAYGEWPKEELDHINGDPLDNRIENLREATRAQNSANRRAKKGKRLKGAYKHRNKWCALFRGGWLGLFHSEEAAHAAYVAAAKAYFGEFSRAA